ncbi:EVE domain-containing protein [Rhabdobacter roseus]|uniref:Putative RNA-binding protein with PUA-like domain n=1 Tax=Rhabdobacter roseus TaxID=1655419 RepID=A0A840TIN1_9BACT|nr:EVE domain-containing protein [Rhabdobacter roseus]MBB5283314.1 putative RNA-binding protein with PUA-like domain [Rhabdobacter roseus]
MNYWIVKSEPFKYSWEHFVSQKRAVWDGVRNYQARNNLMAMRENDLVLFYHSNEGKEVVGLAKVVREHYPDPTTDDTRWVVVDLEPVERLPKPVGLAQLKADERLRDMALIRQSRLSVLPLRHEEFDLIVGLAHEH